MGEVGMTYNAALDMMNGKIKTLTEELLKLRARVCAVEAAIMTPVEITVHNGVAEVTSKPEYIKVNITDED